MRPGVLVSYRMQRPATFPPDRLFKSDLHCSTRASFFNKARLPWVTAAAPCSGCIAVNAWENEEIAASGRSVSVTQQQLHTPAAGMMAAPSIWQHNR